MDIVPGSPAARGRSGPGFQRRGLRAVAFLLLPAGLLCACRVAPPIDPAVPIVPSRLEVSLVAGSKPFRTPVDVAAAPDRREILVADRGNRRVEIFDEQGRYLRSFGQRGGGFIRFRDLREIDVDSRGLVLCLDAGLAAVLTVDPVRGAVVDQTPLGARTFGPGGAREPTGVAVGSGGRRYVPDAAQGTIRVHDARGALIGLLGDDRGSVLLLDRPAGLALDSRGRLVIAETGARRVQVRVLRGGP